MRPRRGGTPYLFYVPVLPSRQTVPNIASAKKNMRKSRAAAVRNRAQRSALRTALKKARAANPASEGEVVIEAVSLLDRAARKGLIHPNKAARHKSQLARRANALAAASAGSTAAAPAA